MAYSNNWLQFCKAEDEYFTCRYDFMQNEEEMVKDLWEALTKAGDRETALRLLLEMKPKAAVVAPLLSKVADTAIDSGNLTAIELARGVLNNYKNEIWAKDRIQTFATNYLIYNDEWHYRRIAELYRLLDYTEELASFVAICQVNNNLEIQEVGNDFLV